MKSIIFNQHQVNYALRNEEGVFRVVIKGNELEISHPAIHSWKQSPNDGKFYAKAKNDEVKQQYVTTFPFGGIELPYQVGETIFVKEKFLKSIFGKPIYFDEDFRWFQGKEKAVKFKSPVHMKQEHSRLTLRIKSVKVERLADISEEDAIKEGFKRIGGVRNPEYGYEHEDHPIERFGDEWDATHKKPEEKWEANPFVFCFSYEVVR